MRASSGGIFSSVRIRSASRPLPAPSNKRRTALAFSLRDSINYPIVPNALTSTIDAEFEPGTITRTSDISASQLTSLSFSSLSTLLVPNDISELRLAFAGRLDLLASSAWSAQGRMSYEENSQDVSLLSNALPGVDPATVTKFATTLEESSFSQQVTQAGTSLRYTPNAQDTFETEFNANLLNYDTPSPLNDDDHDNLITSATLRLGRRFREDLDGGLTLLAARTHLVYLNSSRSAENNVSQSLALFSYANYTTPQLLAWASGEVYANYTVLDYLDSIPLLAGVGNYLLRGLSLSDSIMVPLGIHPLADAGPITFEEGATLRVSERGSYDVAGFSEVLSTQCDGTFRHASGWNHIVRKPGAVENPRRSPGFYPEPIRAERHRPRIGNPVSGTRTADPHRAARHALPLTLGSDGTGPHRIGLVLRHQGRNLRHSLPNPHAAARKPPQCPVDVLGADAEVTVPLTPPTAVALCDACHSTKCP